MHRLAREWLPVPDALFAAACYAVNPYHLVIVYWRGAYAELLAAALLPLLLLGLLRLRHPGVRPVICLGLTFAAAWLTNAPAAIMIHYSGAGMAVLIAAQERSWRVLLRTTTAIALGIGLTSFYLLPAVYEEKWVNIDEVLSEGLRPQENFLFTNTANADHNRFNLLVSLVALAEIAVLVFAIWRARHARTNPLRMPLAAWSVFAVVLLVPISNPLWHHLPKLLFVQLPFRWLLCLNATLALLLTMALRRWLARALTAAVLLAVLVVAGHCVQPPWWDSAGDIQEMQDAMSDGTGNEGIDEYVPARVDPYELNKESPRVADLAGNQIPSQVLQWGAENRHFVVQTARPATLVLRLLDYPAWNVTVNGALVTTGRTEVTGQLLIPVSAGRSEVRVQFGRTLDRTVGILVSMISLILLVAAWVATRPGSATSATA